MLKKRRLRKRIAGAGLSLTLLIPGGAFAQPWSRGPGRDVSAEFPRFSLSMQGGVGTLEPGREMIDLKFEAQVGLSRSLRLGLGIGTMHRGRGDRDGRDAYDRDRRMMGDWETQRGWADGPADVFRDVRIHPLSANLYYALPLGRRADAFMSAGGSYYFGRFDGLSGRQKKNAWGGQAGLGFEYRLAPRFNLIAEGSYRFAEFRGLRAPRNESFINFFPEAITLKPELNRIYRSVVRAIEAALAPPPPRSVDFDFNGFSFRAGVKFGL
ncbi:MAG: porin family protein [Candidatus Aminicenantes bacterium]|nr:porin family protein [Candidatus Aminicenantes bacterium]